MYTPWEEPYGAVWLDNQTLLYSAAMRVCQTGVDPKDVIRTDGPHLFQAALNGGAPTRILEDAAWPSLSSDGRFLAFTWGALSDTPSVVVSAADGSGAKVLGEGIRAQWRPRQ